MNFHALDTTAFAEVGLSPSGVDRSSFRDLWMMFAGARERETSKWRHTTFIAQTVMNHGGNAVAKPKDLGWLFDRMFNIPGQELQPMDGAKLSAMLSSIARPKDG